MRKSVNISSFIAIMALIGLCFWACEEPKSEPDSNAALTGTVSITGTAQVGKMLTANVSALGGSGTISFQWERDYSSTIGSNNSTYMIQDDDVDSIITVTVTRSNNSGSITSDPTDYVIPGDLPALTGTISIIGIAEVGETLTVDISNLGGDGWIDYYWKSHGHTVGYDDTYTVEEYDIGSTVTVTVTRSENAGSITSTPTDIVRTPGLAFTLINNGTAYSVSKGTATSELVAIPAINNGLPVTEIADSGFIEYSNLTNVTIPSGVTKIGNYAFFHCSNLASIVIPSGITNIGNFAFSDCGSLTTVYFGGSSSTEWTTITMGSNNTQLTNATRYYYSSTFQGAPNTWHSNYGEPTLWISDVLHFSLINNGTAYEVSAAEDFVVDTFTIPASYNGFPVTKIADYGFADCINAINIIIPNSVTSIGDEAFFGCTILTNITIPKNATDIGVNPFIDCSSLTSISVESGNTAFRSEGNCLIRSSDNVLIAGCKTSVIPNGVTGIEVGAFADCTGLTSITIPDSVTSIDYCAFGGCTGLTSVTIPDSVTSIGEYAFYGCTGLTSITIPFVGATLNGTTNTHFGYIFGAGFYQSQNTSIPSSLKTVIITGGNRIEDFAFGGCTGLTSVTIPDSVTSIGEYAFYGCTGLTSITISDSVTSIGYSAFYNCLNLSVTWYYNPALTASEFRNYLKTVVVSDSVTSIGNGAFYGCASLTSITILDSVTSIGSSAFYGCSALTSITIPDSVTSIDSYAFRYCSGLTSITIPNSVTSIGSSAFYGCINLSVTWYYNPALTASEFRNYLKTVVVSDSVTSIGNGAFYDCASLTSITIPDSVTSIGSSAFYGCSGLTSITIPDSVTGIAYFTFGYCTSLTSITIPDSVTSIGERAFEGCRGLTSITIPNGVTSIGSSAFYGCSGLTNITVASGNATYRSEGNCIIQRVNDALVLGCKNSIIPNSVTSIDSGAFAGCTSLTSITIPSSVTSIGSGAFSGCSALTNITIPNSVTSIGSSAFSRCTNLTSITIPNSVTSIVSNVFFGCTGLENITVASGNATYRSEGNCIIQRANNALVLGCKNSIIPNNVTSIGSGAFEGCSALTSITIPDSVTSIGELAFRYCTGLTNITIPNSVTRIWGQAFSECTGLTSVTIGTITSANFSTSAPFPGNLRDVYFATGGGAGTYVTSNPGNSAVWVKQ